jgi:hypothetical protein
LDALPGHNGQMKNYQFRTNWRGKLVLQRQQYILDKWGDKQYYWTDATVSDLKEYYQQIYEPKTLPKPLL